MLETCGSRSAASQRQTHRRGRRRTQTVRLGDPAGLVPQVAADHRGATTALPARSLVVGFVPALQQFLGTSSGLPAPTIARLTVQWQEEARTFAGRDLSGADYVYLWADGVHLNVRLDEAKLGLLVMVGVPVDGRKEIVALAEGYRESTESWADLLRGCKRRGMRAPILAVGDGALGFWNGLREVFPQAREGRCWFHKTANVLAALPKSAHPGAKKALAEIWGAEDKPHALAAVRAFEAA